MCLKKYKDIMKISSFSSKSNKIDVNGSYLIMDMGAVDQNGYNISSKLTLSDKDLLSKGEIILVKDDIGGGNIIGKCCIIDQNDKYVCGDHVFKINLNDDIEKLYFCYYNNFINEKRYLQVMTGTSQKSITKGVLEKFTIPYIDMERQIKIGSFFKELDELIDLTKESINYYETVRKGIRQKIFAGEKIQINKLVSIRKGKQLNKDDFDNNGPYPVYNGAKKEIGYHSQYNEEGPKIIINEGGSSGTVSLIKTNFWASGHSYVLDIMEDIDINLLYEALKKEEPKLKSMAYGAGIPSVKAIDILNHYINLPIIPYNKVLDIFENINYIIDELQCKVILLEQTKKYYLNKIFN